MQLFLISNLLGGHAAGDSGKTAAVELRKWRASTGNVIKFYIWSFYQRFLDDDKLHR